MQNHFLQYIEELLLHYAVDGIELDWLRYPTVLPEEKRGDFSILNSYMAKVRALLDKLCDSDTVLTVTGRVPDGIDMDDVKRLIRDFSEKGVRVVVDSRSFALDDLIEVNPFLIKPNEEEIGAYMQRNICNFEDSLAASEELRTRGIKNVMISLGAKGASLSSSDGAFVVPAPKIDPISTIGAGDSSIAGFLMGLSLGESYEDCLRRAVAFGTAACLTSGTRPPRASDVERFLKEGEI